MYHSNCRSGACICVTAIIGVLAAAAGGLLYAFVSLPDLLYAVIAMLAVAAVVLLFAGLMAVLFCLLRSHRLREFLCACGADHRSRHDPLLAAAARTRDLLCRRQLGECPQRHPLRAGIRLLCRDDGRTGLVDHLRPCLPRPPYPHLRADQHQQLQLTPFLCGTRRCSPPLHPLSDLPAGCFRPAGKFLSSLFIHFAFPLRHISHSPFPAL